MNPTGGKKIYVITWRDKESSLLHLNFDPETWNDNPCVFIISNQTFPDSTKRWESFVELEAVGIIDRDLSISKTNQVHLAAIFSEFLIQFEEYSVKLFWTDQCWNFPDVLNLNWLLLKLNRFMCEVAVGSPC